MATEIINRKIRVLPPALVNRIAAGEVIERPASVVKELVENAIDAGATKIDVVAENGGRNIRVADNGSGMNRDDAELAFLNHATSKIADEADLERIQTLGFRGEALASVSAVAKVTCLTRTADDSSGTKVTILNDKIELTDAGCARGTIMDIQDLFYNTPARLKFLKRPSTELGHIEDAMTLLALSHPEIQFSLYLSEKQVLKTLGQDDLRVAMDEVFKLKRNPVKFFPVQFEDKAEDAGLKLTGFISSPETQKSNKRWLHTFINGRAVRCPILMKAIESAYESLLPHGKHPFVVLFITMPYDLVDINVHPAKKEVRYVNPNMMFNFIKHGVLNSLEAHSSQIVLTAPQDYNDAERSMAFSSPLPPSAKPAFHGSSAHGPGGGYSGSGSTYHSSNQTRPAMDFYRPVDSADNQPTLQPEAVQDSLPVEQARKIRVIGQLFNTYILIESPQGLLVVDQHIASERTLFEQLSQNMLSNTPDIQNLLVPESVPINQSQLSVLESASEELQKLGFCFELKDDSVDLTGIPLIHSTRQGSNRQLFDDVLGQLEETGESKLVLDNLIATLSCHQAVRAGDVLTQHQMEKLIELWLECKLPWTCPHGRPIAHTIKTDELNKFFHRPSLPVNA